MKRGELVSVSASLLLIVSALLVVIVRSLPIMGITGISSHGLSLTSSISRHLYPSIGRNYLGLDKRELRREIAALPYVSSVSFSYDKGALVVDGSLKDGVLIASEKEAYFFDGSESHPIPLEDLGSLHGVYSVLAVSDLGSVSDEEKEYIDMVLPHLLRSPSASSLITWIEYDNNIEDGLFELRIALPELNASIVLSEPSALDRLDRSIGIIEEENEGSGGSYIFAPLAEYELYSDRLVRIKG